MAETRMLKTIWGPSGRTEKGHNEDLRKYFRLIKSRWMRWAGHVACVGEIRNSFRVENRALEGRIIMKCTSEILGGRMWIILNWFRVGPGGSSVPVNVFIMLSS